MDFGDQFVGDSALETILISNTGTDSLIISGIISDHPNYTVDTAALDVAPGGSEEITIIFIPTDTGVVEAKLTIISNDPRESEIIVELSGRGIYPPDIAIEPNSLGAVLVPGEKYVDTITISNVGLHDLECRIFTGKQGESPTAELIKSLSGEKSNEIRGSTPIATAPNDIRAQLSFGRKLSNDVIGSDSAEQHTMDSGKRTLGGVRLVSTPFYDDFESGNYDDWIADWGTGVKEVTNDFAAVGRRSFHYYYSGSDPESNNGIHQEFISGVQPAYISFYVRTGATTQKSACLTLRDAQSSL